MEKENYYKKISETHQIENARQRKLKRRKISYIVLITVILVFFIYLCYRYLFKIVSVEYVGNERYTDEQLAEALGFSEGERLFSYSKKNEEKKLLKMFPYLSECEIKRTVPDKVTVSVKEREAIMYTYLAEKYVLFDDEMVVVEFCETEPESLMKTEFDDLVIIKCVLGEKIGFKDEKTGIAVKKVYDSVLLSDLYTEIKLITIKSRFDFYLSYGEKYEIYLGDSNDCDSKLLFADGIIKKLYEEDTGRIDVSDPSKGTFRKK